MKYIKVGLAEGTRNAFNQRKNKISFLIKNELHENEKAPWKKKPTENNTYKGVIKYWKKIFIDGTSMVRESKSNSCFNTFLAYWLKSLLPRKDYLIEPIR